MKQLLYSSVTCVARKPFRDFRIEQKTIKLNHPPKRDAGMFEEKLSILQTYLVTVKHMTEFPSTRLLQTPKKISRKNFNTCMAPEPTAAKSHF